MLSPTRCCGLKTESRIGAASEQPHCDMARLLESEDCDRHHNGGMNQATTVSQPPAARKVAQLPNARSETQQALEKRAVSLQSDAQIFGRHVATASPLRLKAAAFLREGLR
jgi:hypothetical protein